MMLHFVTWFPLPPQVAILLLNTVSVSTTRLYATNTLHVLTPNYGSPDHRDFAFRISHFALSVRCVVLPETMVAPSSGYESLYFGPDSIY